MTTTPEVKAVTSRSRLDPEPMPRRDCLGLSAAWSAGITLLFALFGVARLPRAAVVPVASRKFKVSLPDNLAPAEAFVPPGRSIVIYRDESGVHAISRVCTHLGCLVKSESDGFHCPCHGSALAADGTVVKGPAPKALAWVAISRAGSGIYLVDEGKTVPAGTKVAV